jgi:hypothetical protein
MRINFMGGLTPGFTRKTVNLHVELVSDANLEVTNGWFCLIRLRFRRLAPYHRASRSALSVSNRNWRRVRNPLLCL